VNKLIAATVAVLAFAVTVSAAVASNPSVMVTASGVNYLIFGKAPNASPGKVTKMEILQNGHAVAPETRYTMPTASNKYSFKVLTKQSELPSGNYVLRLVDVVNSKRKNVSIAFSVS
jgi:hypothetical protein